MGISLRTNIASIQANNSLNKTNDALAQNMTKLSSGMRINSASDHAPGLGDHSPPTTQDDSIARPKRLPRAVTMATSPGCRGGAGEGPTSGRGAGGGGGGKGLCGRATKKNIFFSKKRNFVGRRSPLSYL